MFKGEVRVNRNPESWDKIPAKLTPEQEKIRDEIYDKWHRKLTESQDVDQAVIEEEMAWLYAWDNRPPPDVMVVDSPKAVVGAAREYDKKVSSTQWIGLSWDAPRVAFYEAHKTLTQPDGKPMLYHEVMEHVMRMANAGVWDGVLFDGDSSKETGLVIVSRRPNRLEHDEQFRPHSVTGPCISWKDGYALYAYHGIELTERHIMRPDSFTKAELMDARNSEIARAIAEILGWEKFLEKTGTRKIDTFKDVVRSHPEIVEAGGPEYQELLYELFVMDVPDGRWSNGTRFLRMQSPLLHNEKPGDKKKTFYMEPVAPGLLTAQAARKWQIPKSLYPRTEWWSVDECNKDPVLKFVEEA